MERRVSTHSPLPPCSSSACAPAPPDEIFNTGIRYRADKDARKVDLGVGAYRTDEGKPLVLSVVRKAEAVIHADKTLNKEYLGIEGDAKFVKVARELLFGSDSPALIGNRIASAQGISGTGSVRVGLDFIVKFLPKGTTIYVSAPTWGNHLTMFAAAGIPYKQYKYWYPLHSHIGTHITLTPTHLHHVSSNTWCICRVHHVLSLLSHPSHRLCPSVTVCAHRDGQQRGLNIEGMLADLQAAPDRSVILLHACAHNPTGVDPTQEQWKRIATVIRQKQHLPFFDSAYQGFASGDLERDAWAIRYFVREGFELLAAQSFAKNFGLYNERAGTINIVCSSATQAKSVLSQVKMVIRPNYSNPPAHGARIVAIVLSDPTLYAEWKEELKGMSGRINSMRQVLRSELERLKTPGDWSHITSQIGMFSFTGLTAKQSAAMSEKWHIYLLSNGRISMAGLNSKNVKYVAEAMHDVITNTK